MLLFSFGWWDICAVIKVHSWNPPLKFDFTIFPLTKNATPYTAVYFLSASVVLWSCLTAGCSAPLSPLCNSTFTSVYLCLTCWPWCLYKVMFGIDYERKRCFGAEYHSGENDNGIPSGRSGSPDVAHYHSHVRCDSWSGSDSRSGADPSVSTWVAAGGCSSRFNDTSTQSLLNKSFSLSLHTRAHLFFN